MRKTLSAIAKRGLAPEADPKRYNPKTGYYGYPLQDYRARRGRFGATNPLQAALRRRG